MNGEDTSLAIFKLLGEIQQNLGAVNQNVTNLRAELFGEGGRVTTMEARQTRQDNRLWIHSTILIPIMTALHMILHKLGVSI